MLLKNNANISLSKKEDNGGKARHFTSRFIESGIVSYPEFNKTFLLKKEVLDRFIDSMVGCPVCLQHQDVTDDNAKDTAVGYVSRVWYEPKDNWFYCEGVITDKETEELINNGWFVSCSYEVTEEDEGGGTWHDIAFDVEILNGKFEHLAIVETPRYKEATILLNSSERKAKLMGMFNKKLSNAVEEERPKEEEEEEKKEKSFIDLINEVSPEADEETIKAIVKKGEELKNMVRNMVRNEEEETEEEEESEEVENMVRNECDIEKPKKMTNSSFKEVKKIKNSIKEVAEFKEESSYIPLQVRLENGKGY